MAIHTRVDAESPSREAGGIWDHADLNFVLAWSTQATVPASQRLIWPLNTISTKPEGLQACLRSRYLTLRASPGNIIQDGRLRPAWRSAWHSQAFIKSMLTTCSRLSALAPARYISLGSRHARQDHADVSRPHCRPASSLPQASAY